MCVGFGKNIGYEKPYTVIGGIKRTGLKDKPKDIYVQIEISERGKVETQSRCRQRSGCKENQKND